MATSIEVSMPQAALGRCNIDGDDKLDKKGIVSMPQAALGRCNCTPCGPPWILDQNETFGVKPQNPPQIG